MTDAKTYPFPPYGNSTLEEIQDILDQYSIDELVVFRYQLMDTELKSALVDYFKSRLASYCGM